MKKHEFKALRLVTTGMVDVHSWTFAPDEPHELVDAHGTVTGDSGVWTVDIDEGGAWCDCPFGENQPGRSHSHTRALELMALRMNAVGTEDDER